MRTPERGGGPGGAPMTPPSQVARPYHVGYDGSPQVAPFQLPQSWMVTTHDTAYTASPSARVRQQQPFLGDAGGSYDEYSSYNSDHHNNQDVGGYGGQQQQQAVLQARAQYHAMQLAQQMQDPAAGMLPQPYQQDGGGGPAYTFGTASTQAQPQPQPQPYYDYDDNGAPGLASLPDTTFLLAHQQQQQQTRPDLFLSGSNQHDPFLYHPDSAHHHHQQAQPQLQAQHSLYPPIDTIPRQYHGGGDNNGLHLSYHSQHSAQHQNQNQMLDPALLDFGASAGAAGHGFAASASAGGQHHDAFGVSEAPSYQQWGGSFGDAGLGAGAGHAGGGGGEGDGLWGGAFE